jgi:hypothetical protein
MTVRLGLASIGSFYSFIFCLLIKIRQTSCRPLKEAEKWIVIRVSVKGHAFMFPKIENKNFKLY